MARGKEFRGGQYGNTRGKERQKRRRLNREQDPRYVAAMERTREAQAELEALIRRQESEPAEGAVAGAMYAAEYNKTHDAVMIAQAELEELNVEWDPETESVVAAEPVVKITDKPKKFSTKKLRQTGEDKFQFAGLTARLMLTAGYHIEYVLEFTGLGYEDVRHLEIDSEGWGVRPSDDDEDEQEAVDF